MENKRKRKITTGLIIAAVSILALVGVFFIYTMDYYKADNLALSEIAESEDHGNYSVFQGSGSKSNNTGLIFYPGGKVEAAAYAPLLKAISENGITCILVEMPYNLAVFGINSADKIIQDFPDIDTWYLGGHSLGGAMASSYAGKNEDKLAGLILMGAYPVNDSQIPTFVIYGSEDMGLDMSKLNDLADKLEITGGNHSYFGNYGEQKGDGNAVVSRDEQQKITVEAVMGFIN